MNVTGYQLIKCGQYYFLSLDRAWLKSVINRNPIQNQLEDVAFKLVDLNNDSPSTESSQDSSGNDGLFQTLS